ncbi:MAG: 1,4-dihydroxy-6-naphthoate synthase [Thermodesulfobacteriota bacterium]
MEQQLSIGFSPCPNDTFIFDALVHRRLEEECPLFAPPELADVETLNEWAMAGRLDVTKLSFHAFGHVRDRYTLLAAGAALGRGCGPLLVSGRPLPPADLTKVRIAIPGRYTTAAMLLGMFAGTPLATTVMRFDRIMPAIAAGEVDAGVIIHESRFTYQHHGLGLVRDLGSWWEEETGLPIPLGGIVARRSLGGEMLGRISGCIKASILAAQANPAQALPYIRRHAQEMDDLIVQSHIGLYVNHFSVDLGQEGVAAVQEFLRRGEAAGLFPRMTEDFLAPILS